MKPSMLNWTFRISLVCLTLLIGWLLFKGTELSPIAAEFVRLENYATDIAAVYSSYAFTVAGFLATIATFLYTLGGKPYFDVYRRRGSFSDLMLLHGLTMAVLAALFVLSVLMHSHPGFVRHASVLTLLNLLQLTVLTLISYRLSKRSQDAAG